MTPRALEFRVSSASAMEDLGRRMAGDLDERAVFALVGGLGAGKTHWSKGLVAGLGSSAEVTSPTFGLIHQYPGGRLPVIHADFYRLENPEELTAIGWDECLDEAGVIIAEWADKFPQLLPEDAVWLFFRIEPDGGRTVLVGERQIP